MDLYFFIKALHIVSSTILFGTGIGIAFFMFRSLSTDSLHEKLYAARNTVLADYLFTFPAVILQPLSGLWLAYHAGFDLSALWLQLTYALYLFAGLCWLPVVWIQKQLKDMLIESVKGNTSLPARYPRLFKIWCALGVPAFFSLICIFYLMVAKPV